MSGAPRSVVPGDPARGDAVPRGRGPWSAASIGSIERGRTREPDARFAVLRAFLADDTGAATAEYAIATMAAVGFAGLLVVILKGDEVREILMDLVRRALDYEG